MRKAPTDLGGEEQDRFTILVLQTLELGSIQTRYIFLLLSRRVRIHVTPYAFGYCSEPNSIHFWPPHVFNHKSKLFRL